MTDNRNRIKILPEHLVDVIAAGEVVERPASVVKELVENALDAGAGTVRVKIADGGRRMIRVQDDGTGMDEENALLAIERHATSKISSLDDLAHIRTMGFRGEALSSVAAVGRFTLDTWDGKAASGTRVVMDNGKLVSAEPVGRAPGTTVTLEGIFRRLPARRKFLRSRETEQAWCLGAVEDAALANPGVSFSVTGDGFELLNMPPASSLRERVISLWGVETARGLNVLSHEREGIVLDGLISSPAETYSRRSRHRVMVNGRPVRDPALNRFISSALSGSWPAGRFPALILSIVVPDEFVDVNVHPAKKEVRFRRTEALAEALREAVRKLGSEIKTPGTYDRPGLVTPGTATAAGEVKLPFGNSVSGLGVVPQSPSGGRESAAPGRQGGEILGQVLGTYILLSDENGLHMIDQHAAHERIVFNRLLARRSGREIPVQRLAVPMVLTLSPSEASRLAGATQTLNSFGFEIGQFGVDSVRVTAVPSDLKAELVEDLLRELASDPEPGGKTPEGVALAVSRWACRQSVMAGRRLSEEEMAHLVAELEKTESGFACPHGRPTRVSLDRASLEKLFGRR